MDESDVRLHIDHALQWYGYWPKHDQDGRVYSCNCWRCKAWNKITVTAEVKGYPDLDVKHPYRPTCLLEAKVIPAERKSFSVSQIKDEQRGYLTNWMLKGGKSYFGLGVIFPFGKTKTQIVAIGVFPWEYWLAYESLYAIDGILAWDWSEHMRKPKGWERSRSIVTLANEYFLTKTADEDWQFNPSHPLAEPGRVNVPHYRRARAEGTHDQEAYHAYVLELQQVLVASQQGNSHTNL